MLFLIPTSAQLTRAVMEMDNDTFFASAFNFGAQVELIQKRSLQPSWLLSDRIQTHYCQGAVEGTVNTVLMEPDPWPGPSVPGSSEPLSPLGHFPTAGQELQKPLQVLDCIEPAAQKGALQKQTSVPLSRGGKPAASQGNRQAASALLFELVSRM